MKFLLGFITGVACSLILFWILDKSAPETTSTASAIESDSLFEHGNVAELPPRFEAFYNQFHTDSVFQLEHIIFPLEGLPPNVDSLTLVNRNFRWQKQSWVLHRPFNAMGGSFERDFINLGGEMVVEHIQHESGRYAMERRFAQFDDGWYLIYYAAMNEMTQE